MADNSQPREAEWFSFIKGSKFGLTLAAAVVILTGLASFTDSADRVMVWTGLKPDQLQLAEAGEKEKFSRELTRTIWQRLHQSRRALSLLTSPNAPTTEKERQWERYQTVVDDWNRDLMVNIILLNQYYGRTKRNQFENAIQRDFATINRCLALIRRPVNGKHCAQEMDVEPERLEAFIDVFNSRLYCYVSGLPQREDVGCFR